MGLAKNLFRPATQSAAFVKSLIDLGAVPFCKTNVPQTIFSNAGENPVFGATKNGRTHGYPPVDLVLDRHL